MTTASLWPQSFMNNKLLAGFEINSLYSPEAPLNAQEIKQQNVLCMVRAALHRRLDREYPVPHEVSNATLRRRLGQEFPKPRDFTKAARETGLESLVPRDLTKAALLRSLGRESLSPRDFTKI